MVQGLVRGVVYMLNVSTLVTHCEYVDMSNLIKMCVLNMDNLKCINYSLIKLRKFQLVLDVLIVIISTKTLAKGKIYKYKQKIYLEMRYFQKQLCHKGRIKQSLKQWS